MMMGLDLILLVVVGAIVYALGWRPQLNQTRPAENSPAETGPAQSSQTPLEILKARYARGEITGEEYDQIRRDLEG